MNESLAERFMLFDYFLEGWLLTLHGKLGLEQSTVFSVCLNES